MSLAKNNNLEDYLVHDFHKSNSFIISFEKIREQEIEKIRFDEIRKKALEQIEQRLNYKNNSYSSR